MKIFVVMSMVSASLAVIGASVGWISETQNNRERVKCLAHARGLVQVISSSRQIYSDCRAAEDPLPIEFARRIMNSIEGASVSIYSKYPFPSNKTGGLSRDDKRLKAWTAIVDNQQKEYVDSTGGIFQYAVPDVMSRSCVECHNRHPETPKADWKVGDVRGIIDVRIRY